MRSDIRSVALDPGQKARVAAAARALAAHAIQARLSDWDGTRCDLLVANADDGYGRHVIEIALWRGHGFHYVSVQIPGLSKPWYSFLKRLDRSLGPLPKADDLD